MIKKPKHREATLTGRRCMICNRIGGTGFTTALQLLGYNVPKGEIRYAHGDYISKLQKQQIRNND